MRQPIFDLAINCTGRILVARDLAFGRIRRKWVLDAETPGARRLTIRSGANLLDAVLVEPIAQPARASLLICHGIGETVQHWHRAQLLLAANGVTSLVFDYSGYGKSSGLFSARQSELDAEEAFATLERLTAPLPVALLGFSLGSGIAAAIQPRVTASSLLLCSAFSSVRAAAGRVGRFGLIRHGTPAIWNSVESLRACKVPVHIVHGGNDRLFPVAMAAELKAACASRVELVVVPGIAHNEPYSRPHLSFWGPVLTHLLDGPGALVEPVSGFKPDRVSHDTIDARKTAALA